MSISLMGEIFFKTVFLCVDVIILFCLFDYMYVLCRHKFVRPAHMVHKILVFY